MPSKCIVLFASVTLALSGQITPCFTKSSRVIVPSLKSVGFVDPEERAVADKNSLYFTSDSVIVGSIYQTIRGTLNPTGVFAANVKTGSIRVRHNLTVNGKRQIFPIVDGFVYDSFPETLLCNNELSCKNAPLQKKGDLLSSPSGTTFSIKNDVHYSEISMHAHIVRRVEKMTHDQVLRVLPGDNAFAFQFHNSLQIVRPSGVTKTISVDSVGLDGCCTFIDATRIALLTGPPSRIRVFDLLGREIYSIKQEESPSRIKLKTSLDGSRFLAIQLGYSDLNKVSRPFDIDSGRPFDVVRVSVRDSKTGAEIAADRCSGSTQVALSPNGHQLAVEQGSKLRVIDLP